MEKKVQILIDEGDNRYGVKITESRHDIIECKDKESAMRLRDFIKDKGYKNDGANYGNFPESTN